MSLESITDDAADNAEATTTPDLMPIRDVARITGVNAVTLRAWERRYGLIVPHRTSKGHRLYSHEHVTRVQAILTWLNRGVAVSQVKSLLRTDQPIPVEASSQWEAKRQQLQDAICSFNERRLDDCLNSELAVYPPQTLCQQLLMPLLEALELRWRNQFGAQAERVFFYSWLRSKLGARLYHNNRQHNGAPLLLINVSDLPMAPGLWLTAWLASSAGFPIDVFDGSLPPVELALAVEHIQPRAVLLYSSQALNSTHLQRLLGGYGCPCLLIGQVVQIHAQELHSIAEQNSELRLAADPPAALRCLTDLSLLND